MYLGTKPKVKVTTGPVEDMDLGERKGKKLGLNPTEAFGPSYCCDLLRQGNMGWGKLHMCGTETRIRCLIHCLRCPLSTKVEMLTSCGISKSKFNVKIRVGDQFWRCSLWDLMGAFGILGSEKQSPEL